MSYGGKSPLGDLGVNYHKFTKVKTIAFLGFKGIILLHLVYNLQPTVTFFYLHKAVLLFNLATKK
jgi:hypothetical protein